MRIIYQHTFLLFCLFFSVALNAQQRALLDLDGVPLYSVFDRVESVFGVKVYYHPDHIPSYETFISKDSLSLFDVFRQATMGTSLKLVKYDTSSYIAAPERFQSKAYADEVVEGWRSGRYRSPSDETASLLRIVRGEDRRQQSMHKFIGQILDDDTGEPIYGVTVFHPLLAKGTTSDIDGMFELELPSGVHQLQVRLLGYLEQPIELLLFDEGPGAEILLTEQAIGMDEVVVSARSNKQNLRDQAMGVSRLSSIDLKKLPVLAGELNVLQSLATQAGVSATSEGSSAITVRGGGLDQNLILQSGMPILYPAHALGFFPLTHPDMVAGVELYKGYIPARFGGRSTSVVDISWKSGDYKNWSLNGGTSFFSSRLSVSGPVVKDKVAIIVGGRSSHLNYLLKQVRNGDVKRSAVGFTDLSVKISTKWKGGGIDVSGAYAQDDFRYNYFFGYDYFNFQGGIKIRQKVNDKTYVLADATTSSFVNSLNELRTSRGEFALRSGINQHQVTASLQHTRSDELSFRAGIGFTYYQSEARELSSPLRSPVIPYSYEDPDLLLPYAFGESDWELLPPLSLQAGIRLSMPRTYIPAGPRYRYEGLPGAGNVLEIESRTAPSMFAHPFQVQPRLALSYQIDNRNIIAVAYSRMIQAISQLSTTVSPTPADMFFVSSEHIPITQSDGVSLTYSALPERITKPNGFDVSVYWRNTNGVNLGRQGELLRSSDFPEQGIYSLQGYAYGIELGYSLKARTSSLDISYSAGRSWLRPNFDYPEFRLGDRTRIPAPTDIPHQVNLQYTTRFSGRTSFTTAWMFASGRPITAADAQLPFDGLIVPVFGQVNGSRLPPTHRLDLSFVVDNSQSLRKGVRLGFGVSFYNLYQRENPFLAYYKYANGGRLTGYQFALIGDVIPALNFTLTWD